jgi:glycosyltransferase involved in cell wall biosynthesis
VSPYYAKADLVIVPSRWQEPFGLIGVEAFAHGKPVIGFDVGGISEWLHDGENGFLIPACDVNRLAERIEYLIGNPLEMMRLGENGYRLVAELFTKERFLDGFNAALRIAGIKING